jgi:3-oxoacyl-[acyl-carrier protein] reductase
MEEFQPFDPAALAGRVALITGGGGGIGRVVARRFAGLGVRLALADLSEEGLRLTAEAVPCADVLTWGGDLSDEAAVEDLFRQVLERFGTVHVAVNAAGVLKQTRLDELSKAEWDEVLGANLTSAFLVCRECCAPMRAQGWGRIVNFSSLAAHAGGILAGPHYAAAKAGVISLTRSVAKYLAPHGVRCNAIAPSGVETDMLRLFTDEQQANLLQGIPMRRFATPEDVAELVLWLSSPASDYITGQTIDINGGAYFGS